MADNATANDQAFKVLSGSLNIRPEYHRLRCLQSSPVSVPRLSFLFRTWFEQLPFSLDWKRRLAGIQIFVDVRFNH